MRECDLSNILNDHIALWRTSPFASQSAPAWEIVADLPGIVGRLLGTLDPSFEVDGDIAVHRTPRSMTMPS